MAQQEFRGCMAQPDNAEIFRTTLDNLLIGVCLLDRSGKILFWNRTAERLTGYIQHELIGRSGHDNLLVHANGAHCCVNDCPITQALQQGRLIRKRMQLRHKQGHTIPAFMHLAPIRDSHGSVTAVAISFDSHVARTQGDRDQRGPVPPGCVDEASGVANQSFTRFHLRERLAGFAEYHVPFSVICVRVNRLEDFRTTYGNLASDAILHAVAQTLRYIVRPSDLLGRWSQAEFLVVLNNCGAMGAEKSFERVHRMAAGVSIRWWGDQLTLTTSTGYAFVEAEDTVESLVARAQRELKGLSTRAAAADSGAPSGAEG
jgi:PAS domain S-box-containing protein/diguanylate cyclase (GGDEF)-like protein